jgi:hypothetical protein
MAEKIVLTAYEIELLKLALPYAVKLETAGETLTRDGLRRELSCGKDIASRLRVYLKENQMAKVAARLVAIPENAEIRNEVQLMLGDTTTDRAHLLRENSRLLREVSRLKARGSAEKDQRAAAIREEIEELKSLAKSELGAVKKLGKSRDIPEGDLLLEVSPYDHHFGKLVYPKEVNDVPYDLEVAEAMYNRAIDTLLKRASVHKFERVLFCLGQDLLHSNGMSNSTAKGTQLDCDGRFFRTYNIVRKVMIETIEKLRRVAPVDILTVAGNHDRSIWTLADSVDCYFSKQPDVHVDNAPTLRKYYSFGKVGFMLTHGDLGVKKDFPLVFATEAPEIFANSMWREIRCGHIHSTQVNEVRGVQIRTQPSMSSSDAWHFENMYTKNLRNAYAYVFSKTEGLIAQYTYCDNAYPEIKSERRLV